MSTETVFTIGGEEVARFDWSESYLDGTASFALPEIRDLVVSPRSYYVPAGSQKPGNYFWLSEALGELAHNFGRELEIQNPPDVTFPEPEEGVVY